MDTNFDTHQVRLYYDDEELLGMCLELKDAKRREWHEAHGERLIQELREVLNRAHEKQQMEEHEKLAYDPIILSRFVEKYPVGSATSDAIGKSLHHAFFKQQHTENVLQWNVDPAHFLISGEFMRDVLELLLEGLGLHIDLEASSMSLPMDETPMDIAIDLDKPLVFHVHPEITNDSIRQFLVVLNPFSRLNTIHHAGTWESSDLMRLNYEPSVAGWNPFEHSSLDFLVLEEGNNEGLS
eukprot:CAMPEP_0117454930 /NCGR_PEP_ID=MMETSP0759-20121206/11075_1 /TAXON_ID=63605 /ORGANISM="Percolomonas cosmopolitus, Strain WS" /LENGTH=238 /DNA_ID=CAMNT_0005248173 /DNA_START=234 /DNA_END=948 /DNA_ORIENTATION=-